MAHRLSPSGDRPFLRPEEVVELLREEFAFVEADREAGADHVGDMIVQFLRMRAPDEVIEAYRRIQAEAIRVIVADDPTSDISLRFVAMPEEGLLIGYHSQEHQDETSGLLQRCAEALGYEINLV